MRAMLFAGAQFICASHHIEAENRPMPIATELQFQRYGVMRNLADPPAPGTPNLPKIRLHRKFSR
jgi:hypothetical protein